MLFRARVEGDGITAVPVSSTSPTTSPPATSTSPKRRKVKYAKAFSYLLDPYLPTNQPTVQDGTTIEEDLFETCAVFCIEIDFPTNCGIKFSDMIRVRHPDRRFAPICCVVVATNLSERSNVPRTGIIEKEKEFLGTTEEPKW